MNRITLFKIGIW